MTVKAYVTKDGKVIKGNTLNQYAIKQESKQIPEDRFATSYDKKQLKKPPYSLETLSQIPEMSTWHYRACVAKAMDVVGHGFKLNPLPEVENPNKSQLEIWENFKNECELDGQTVDEIFYKSAYDYEVIGNGTIELIRDVDPDGPLHSMKHIPSHTVRRKVDDTIPLGNGDSISGMKIYVQKRGKRVVYFKQAGANFDIHYRTGEVAPLGEIPLQDRGNEILHIVNYTNRSDYYGLPDIMASLPSVLGDRQAQMYNVEFFENHGVPDYAVTVTGADLDQETEDIIHDYFQNKVKDSTRSTLVLTASREENTPGAAASSGIDIKFQKLTTDVRDGSFKIYRQDNRDEILSANGVPPYRASVAVVGSLGGDLAKDMDEIYKENIIDYRQTVIENRIQSFILKPLGITDYKLAFTEFDTASDEREVDKKEKFFKMGALTPNELRDFQGLETIDEAGMNTYYLEGQAIAGPLYEEQKEKEEQQQTMAPASEAAQLSTKAVSELRKGIIDVVSKYGQ